MGLHLYRILNVAQVLAVGGLAIAVGGCRWNSEAQIAPLSVCDLGHFQDARNIGDVEIEDVFISVERFDVSSVSDPQCETFTWITAIFDDDGPNPGIEEMKALLQQSFMSSSRQGVRARVRGVLVQRPPADLLIKDVISAELVDATDKYASIDAQYKRSVKEASD